MRLWGWQRLRIVYMVKIEVQQQFKWFGTKEGKWCWKQGKWQRRTRYEKELRTFWKFGFELFVFTVDLDLISIQLRHAVNAKRGIYTASRFRFDHFIVSSAAAGFSSLLWPTLQKQALAGNQSSRIKLTAVLSLSCAWVCVRTRKHAYACLCVWVCCFD